MNGMTAQRPAWRRIALPVSVILNLFLLAVIGGHVWRIHSGSVTPVPLARLLTRAAQVLPPPDAQAFSAVMLRDGGRFNRELEQLHQNRLELDRQINAEHYDPAAARKALDTTVASWNHFMDAFSDPLLDALSQVSPEGRRKLMNAGTFAGSAVP